MLQIFRLHWESNPGPRRVQLSLLDFPAPQLTHIPPSQVINVSSPCLLEYIPSISQVLDIALYLSNKEGYALASKILINVLSSATQIRPVNSKAYSKSYDLPTSEFLPIRVSKQKVEFY